jgi:hypothetical protein
MRSPAMLDVAHQVPAHAVQMALQLQLLGLDLLAIGALAEGLGDGLLALLAQPELVRRLAQDLSRERWHARGTRWRGARRGPGWPFQFVCLGHCLASWSGVLCIGQIRRSRRISCRVAAEHGRQPSATSLPASRIRPAAAPRPRRCFRPRSRTRCRLAASERITALVDDDEGLVAGACAARGTPDPPPPGSGSDRSRSRSAGSRPRGCLRRGTASGSPGWSAGGATYGRFAHHRLPMRVPALLRVASCVAD